MAADISILDIEWDPPDPQSGEDISFRVEVINNGTSKADSVEVLVFVEGQYAHVPPNFSLAPDEQRWSVWSGSNSFSAGTHDAVAEVEGHDSEEFTIQVGGNFGHIKGTVQTENGQPVSGSRMYLTGGNIDTRSGRVDDGEFRFDNVPPGSYTVRLTDTRFNGFSQSVEVREGSVTKIQETVSVPSYELKLKSDPISVPLSGDGTYENGAEVTIEAPSKYDGYRFERWRGTGGTTVWEDEEFSFTIREDETYVAQYSEPGLPDLRISSISPSPESPTADDSVSFDVDLANSGESAARNFDLRLSTSGHVTNVTGLDLDADSTGTVPDIGAWDLAEGSHTIRAEVNYNQLIEEESYRNNEDSRRVYVKSGETDSLPNFALLNIEALSSSPSVGDEITVVADIQNSGEVAVDDVKTTLTVDDREENTEYFDLNEDSKRTVTLGTFVPDTTGSITIRGEIDPDGRINERSRSNNVDSVSLSVGDDQAQLPELIAGSISTIPETSRVGDDVEVTAVVSNTGREDIQNVGIELVVDGEVIETDRIAIESEESETVTVGRFIPESEGETTIQVYLDRDEEIEKQREASNVATKVLRIKPRNQINDNVSISNWQSISESITNDSEIELGIQVANDNEIPVEITARCLLVGQDSGDEYTYESGVSLTPEAVTEIPIPVEISEEYKNEAYEIRYRVLRDDTVIASKIVEQTFEVDIPTTISGDVTVRAITFQGEDIKDLSANIEKQDQTLSKSSSSSSGAVRFRDLPGGVYNYTITAKDRNQTRAGSLLIGSKYQEREIIFPPSRPLSGIVIGSDDEPVTDSTVRIRSHNISESVSTNSMGLFAFEENIPAEDVEFEIETATSRNQQTIDTEFNDYVSLVVGEAGHSLQPDASAGDDPSEELSLSETNAIVSLIARNPHFDAVLAQSTMGPRLGYGLIHGLVTSILDTATDVKDTISAVLKGLMNFPETINTLINFIENVWENKAAIVASLPQLIMSAPEAAGEAIDNFDDKQEKDNPYTQTDYQFELRYEHFKSGWYLGYTAGILLLGAGTGKLASKGATLFKSFERVNDAVDRISKTISRRSGRTDANQNLAASMYSRIDLPDSKVALASGGAIGGSKVTSVIEGAAEVGVKDLMEDWARGKFSINHRYRGIRDDSNQPSTPEDLDRDGYAQSNWYKLSNSEINNDGFINGVKGFTFEAITIPRIIRSNSGEFRDISETQIMGRYDKEKLDIGDDGLVMSVDLQNLDIPSTVRNQLGLSKSVSGEFDLVRVVKNDQGDPIVTRIYETKSGSTNNKDIAKKQRTYQTIKELDENPDFDSSTQFGESGLTVRSFTRAANADNRLNPTLKYILPRNGKIYNRDRDAERNSDLTVSDSTINMDVLSDDIKKLTEYIFGRIPPGSDAKDRRDALEFLTKPTRTYGSDS